MEITKDFLKNIYERVQQVFIAKTGHKADEILMDSDGGFNCSKSWNVSYGGTETISERISYFDLTQDLDVLIRARKEEEAMEIQKRKERQEKLRIENEKIAKNKRRLEYEKLKKEFE